MLVTLGSGSMLALEGGLVRGVRRVPEVWRAPQAAAPSQRRPASNPSPVLPERTSRFVRAARSSIGVRVPAAHVRVPPELPLYDMPRRWLRMAYCTRVSTARPTRPAS